MDGYSGSKSSESLPLPFRQSLTSSVPSLGEPWRTSSQNVLPPQGLPSPAAPNQHGRVDLAALLSTTEQHRLKLSQVEKAVAEVQRKLDDWTDVTKSGMESLRSEIGAIKLEHRFSQTLRSTNSRDDQGTPGRRGSTPQRSPRPVPSLTLPERISTESSQAGRGGSVGGSVPPEISSKRLEAVEAACQDLRHNINEVTSVPEATERLLKAELNQVVSQLRDELQLERTKAEQNAVDLIRVEASGAELLRRVEETERRMQELQQDHLSDTVAVKGRLEVAVRECDKQVARADEVQTAFKVEMMEDVNQLRDKLQLQLDKVEERVLGITHVEAQNLEMSRRLEESDRKLWELQQAQTGQTAENSTVRSRLEVAVRECMEQVGQAEDLRGLLQEEKSRRMSESSALLLRVEAVEQAVADRVEATTLLSRLQKLEDSQQDVQRYDVARMEATTSASLQHTAADLRLELQKEVERLQSTVDQAKVECFHRVEERSAELSHRLQEAKGDEKPHAPDAEHFQKLLQEAYADFLEACRQETGALGSRLDSMEKQLIARPAPEPPKVAPLGPSIDAEVLAPVLHRMDQLEANQRVVATPDPAVTAVLARLEGVEASHIHGLRERVEALERSKQSSMEFARSVSKDASEMSPSSAAPADVDELRRALAATSGDVACLARDLAAVREEHDAAITGIGGLTEFVARAAATSIQRTEERMAEELATKREEFEKAANAQREALSLKAQAMLAEAAANLGSARRQQADSQSGSATSSYAHGMDKEGDFHLEDMSRVDVLAVQLRAEAAAQSATNDARISAAEAVFSADMKRFRGMLSACVGQLEAAQVDVHDLRPRVAALEAAVASRDRKASAPQGHSVSLSVATTPAPPKPLASPTGAAWAGPQQPASPPAEDVPRDAVPTRDASPRRAGTVAGISTEGGRCGRSSSPLRGMVLPPGPPGVEAPFGHAWRSTFQKVMQASAPNVLTSEVAPSYRAPGQQVQEGLKEKLEGIVSSVHQVLGALNLQHKQPEPAGSLGALGQPMLPAPTVSPPPAPLARASFGLSVQTSAQRDPAAAVPGLWPLPLVGAGPHQSQSPVREQSPFRRVVPQEMPMPQPQQPLQPPGALSAMVRTTGDEAASVSVAPRLGMQSPERGPGAASPAVPNGPGGVGQMAQPMRGRSQDASFRLSQTWNGQPGHAAGTLGQRPSVTPMTGAMPGGPVAGIANAAAAALSGAAHPGLRDRQVRGTARMSMQAVSSPVSNAGSVASAKNSSKGLATRPPGSVAGSTAGSVRSSTRNSPNVKL